MTSAQWRRWFLLALFSAAFVALLSHMDWWDIILGPYSLTRVKWYTPAPACSS